jgi:hypothetical protein
MSDQIRIKRSDSSVSIEIDGVSSAIGFLELMYAAKFQHGVSWKYLLSPHVNEIIKELLGLIKSDERFANFPGGGVPDNRRSDIYDAIEDYISAAGVDAENRGELLKAATYPYEQ